LFVQFAPYSLSPSVGHWADDGFKQRFVDRVFALVDQYVDNFSNSIIGYDALSPLDLERVFGLQGGSITHGALSLNQLLYNRYHPNHNAYDSPIPNLYMAGSGCHPGGGVMGAAGRNAANTILRRI